MTQEDIEKLIIQYSEGATDDVADGVRYKLLAWAILTYFNDEDSEPYFGWCDVEGCKGEGCNGGGCWRETGYWTVCDKHSTDYRAGKPQPKMKQSAIDREKTRGLDGCLPYVKISDLLEDGK
jgi:hypothetical protein